MSMENFDTPNWDNPPLEEAISFCANAMERILGVDMDEFYEVYGEDADINEYRTPELLEEWKDVYRAAKRLVTIYEKGIANL